MRAPASSQYTIEFIPYYTREATDFDLTDKEALLYGFIRFYTKNGHKFYFNNLQLAIAIRASERTVTRALQKLNDVGLLEVVYKQKAGGGEIRFVNPSDRHFVQPDRPIDKMSIPDRHNVYRETPGGLQAGKKEENLQAKNKIKRSSSTNTQFFSPKTANELFNWLTTTIDFSEAWELAKESASKTNTRMGKEVFNASVKKFCEFNTGKKINKQKALFYLKRWFEKENWDYLWDTTEGTYDGLS